MIRVKENRMCKGMIVAACVLAGTAGAEEQIVIDKADMAGMSGFRAHWDQTIQVAQDGAFLKDEEITTRLGSGSTKTAAAK